MAQADSKTTRPTKQLKSPAKKPGKRLSPRFTDQEVEPGLVATALASGNSRKAAEMLASHGVTHSELEDWGFDRRFREWRQGGAGKPLESR